MSKFSAPVGAIVHAWFPESEAVMTPGPKLRPVLVLSVEDRGNGRREALVAYGTSQHPERVGQGSFTISAAKTKALKVDTRFDLQRRLWLPLDERYFDTAHAPEIVPLDHMAAFRREAVNVGLVKTR